MPRYTYELLAPVVARCNTWAQVCRELNVKPFTGAQTHLTNRAKSLGIDSSHFLGKGHGKSKRAKNRKSLDEMLTNNPKAHRIRLRLIEDGHREEKCEVCGITSWQDESPPLELHHIDSNHDNWSLDNLQILCANCHALETRASVAKRKTRNV